MKAFIEEIKRIILLCEEHDQKLIVRSKESACIYRAGWADSFFLSWDKKEVSGWFEYSGIYIDDRHYEDKPKISVKSLNQDVFHKEVVPALEQWLDERVKSTPYGGFYNTFFRLVTTFDLRKNYNDDNRWFQADIQIQDEQRLLTEQEHILHFVQNKLYETMNIDSPAYRPALARICMIAGRLIPEVPVKILKEMYGIMIDKAEESRFNHVTDVLTGLYSCAYEGYSNDAITPEQEELYCWIGLALREHGTDKYERKYGMDVLKALIKKGSERAELCLLLGDEPD